MDFTAEFVEREYNNRAAVPEHQAFFSRWERDAAFARATLEARLDIAYGPDPRHRLDHFPASNARGTLVFIHGGYWRALDKRLFAWLAPAWVAEGFDVVTLNYRLCPQVRIGEIVEDVIAATNFLFEQAIVRDRMVLAGHSAGGHLVAALFAAAPKQFRFDAARIAGGVPISGIFDFAPLPLYSANEDLRLDAGQVRELDLGAKPRSIPAPLVVVAGGAETTEFQRQSTQFAAAWSPQVRQCLLLPGQNHFSILDGFIERSQPLHEATLGLF